MKAINFRFLHPSSIVTGGQRTTDLSVLPPPEDFVVSYNKDGSLRSLYSDNTWDFSAYKKTHGASGHVYTFLTRDSISEENLAQFKQLFIAILYHPQLHPGSISSCGTSFYQIKAIAAFCTQNNILMTDLYKYESLFPSLGRTLSGSRFNEALVMLHRFNFYSEEIGLQIASDKLLKFLSGYSHKHQAIQTPYMPPRIWEYQINRLSEILEKFDSKKENVAKVFNKICKAYEHNRLAPSAKGRVYPNPFDLPQNNSKNRVVYPDGFSSFAEKHDIKSLIESYYPPNTKLTLGSLSALMTLTAKAALFYIANYSLQRKEEVAVLRSDCFHIEKDSLVGEFATLTGETTKTDSDSDARWVVPTHVKKAIDIASFIANLRYAQADEKFKRNYPDASAVPLAIGASEPWSKDQASNFQGLNYNFFSNNQPFPFNPEELKITDNDARIAMSLTPGIDRLEWFGVGKAWRLQTHQLRRTANVNMRRGGISDASLQWMNKHSSRVMTLYYGRNYTNLIFNKNAINDFIREWHLEIHDQLTEVIKNHDRYVRPHHKELIPEKLINLVENQEEKKLISLIKKEQVACRKTILGFCFKSGPCEYGGIESISQCAGSTGGGICADAIFDKKNKEEILVFKASHETEKKTLQKHDPRYKAIGFELKAIEVYLNVIS